MPTIDLTTLPEPFRQIPEPLARLAAAWQMVAADEPAQVQLALPAQRLEALRKPDTKLLLVGAREDAPFDLDAVARAIVESGGAVIDYRLGAARTGLYGAHVLTVTGEATAIYEYDSANHAYYATRLPAARTDPAGMALARQELRRAEQALHLAKQNHAAHHAVATRLSEALGPLLDGPDRLAAGIAAAVVARQRSRTAEADREIAHRQAVVDDHRRRPCGR